jgi:hypothetical protein
MTSRKRDLIDSAPGPGEMRKFGNCFSPRACWED